MVENSPREGGLGHLERLLSLSVLGREGAQVEPLVHRVRRAGQNLGEGAATEPRGRPMGDGIIQRHNQLAWSPKVLVLQAKLQTRGHIADEPSRQLRFTCFPRTPSPFFNSNDEQLCLAVLGSISENCNDSDGRGD